MTSPSTTTPVVAQREDTRTDGPMTGGEQAILNHWLDLYRDTALLKLAGLDAEQLTRRAVPPSSMSLIGIVRHLTEVVLAARRAPRRARRPGLLLHPGEPGRRLRRHAPRDGGS